MMRGSGMVESCYDVGIVMMIVGMRDDGLFLRSRRLR